MAETYRINDIVIGERHRRDMGDIEGLARSMDEIGLLQPVVIRPGGQLIAGERRILAARLLGWDALPVHVIDIESLLRGELDENAIRKDFAPSEAVAIWQAMESHQGQKAPHPQLGQSRPIERAAQTLGMSKNTLSKAKQVVDSGDDELVERMDRTGNVTGPYREVRRRRDAEAIREIEIPTGKYNTIVMDPPWDWGDEGDVSQMGRSKPTYSTMPIAQVAKLPVADLADTNCHLYLWITNRSLPKGFALFDAWGFRYITTLTWCKPSIGVGNYYRNNTEHLLFGLKGSRRLLRFDVGTWFTAPRPGQHSAKPQEAYDMIASCSPSPRLDMFARNERDGFTPWGNMP